MKLLGKLGLPYIIRSNISRMEEKNKWASEYVELNYAHAGQIVRVKLTALNIFARRQHR